MDADLTPRFHERLVGRVLLYVGLPLAVFIVVVIAINARRNFIGMREAAERDLRGAVALDAGQIEDWNNNAAQAARILADAQADGLFGDRPGVLALMEHMVMAAPRFNGLFCVYEPDADGADARGVDHPRGTLPAGALTESGRFGPYVYRVDPGGSQLRVEPNVDMEISAYYQGVKDAFLATGRSETMVTEPYVYRGTGKMLVEFSHPILREGGFVGVAGVDLILVDVQRRLRSLAESAGTDAFLISSQGNFIAAAVAPGDGELERVDPELETKPVSRSGDGPALGRVLVQTSELGLILDGEGPGGTPHYYAWSRIPTGAWLLVLRQPEASVLAPAWAQTRRTVGLAATALIIIIGALVGTAVGVGRRVRRAAEAATRIADGDLTEVVDPGSSRDETGLLLRAIRSMTESLNALVSDVKRASIQLHSTATELAATSREQQGTISSFGASTTQIAAATEEISATGGELVQTMADVGRVAEETAGLASAGRSSLQGMDATMRSLEEATVSIAAKLATINAKANDITGVVTTIVKVADQTNLLSVNAAIEAEKAGESGVGFLVVAREIRRLADQTASATLDIEETVRHMQSAVSEGVMEMDRFAERVRVSVKDVADVTGRMERIIEQVDANTESFVRVTEGMQSQSQGAAQINESMQQLTESATRTSEAIGEYARAADHLETAIATLKAAVATFQLQPAEGGAR